jgi:hypothetical protein
MSMLNLNQPPAPSACRCSSAAAMSCASPSASPGCMNRPPPRTSSPWSSASRSVPCRQTQLNTNCQVHVAALRQDAAEQNVTLSEVLELETAQCYVCTAMVDQQ